MTTTDLGPVTDDAGLGTATDSHPDQPGTDLDHDEREQRDDRRIVVVSALVAFIPTLVSVWWALAKHEWMAGDRAIMGIFTHDVLSKNPPLLATVSTMGNYSGNESAAGVHHLGPAQFWALTPFDWAFGGHPAGLIVGALAINLVSIGLVVAFTRRRLDARAAAAMALVCTILSYGLGPSLLRDIWTPFLGLWPMLALIVLVWSLLDGDVGALPWAVAMATFLAQIELLFVAPAAVLSIVGGVGFLLGRRTLRRTIEAGDGTPLPAVSSPPVTTPARVDDHDDHDDIFFVPARPAPTPTPEVAPVAPAGPGSTDPVTGPPVLAPARRATVISVVVALWLWSPVIWDELHGKPGNLTLLWRALGHQNDRAGWNFVWHHVIAQLEVPPVWMRRATTPYDIGHDATVFTVASALAFFGLYVAVTVFTHRTRRARPTRYYLMITGYAVLLAGFVNLWITPKAGIIGLQYRRWIWPSGAYLWFALGIALASEIADRTDFGRYRREPARTVAIPLLVLALLVCVPAARGQLTPPSQDVPDNKVIESMWAPLSDRLPPQATYVSLDGAQSAFGVGPEIIRRLIVQGFTVRVPSFAVDSYGPHREYRRSTGPVAQTLRIVTGTSLAPSDRPAELLAAGRRDGRSGERYVALITPILARAGTSAAFVADHGTLRELGKNALADRPDATRAAGELLADPVRAIFDTTVIRLVAEGRITGGPLTRDQAIELLPEAEALDSLAFLSPPPGPPDH